MSHLIVNFNTQGQLIMSKQRDFYNYKTKTYKRKYR